MLSEHFIASVGSSTKTLSSHHIKDAGIFLYELQPLAAQKSLFKKSSTAQNCLAVSETHIFAAQAEKAVIHVYNRAKGNQEAIVPFPQQITAIHLAADDSLLILGTASGQILLWEVCLLVCILIS
jgi:pre-rRNA-processing protein IPI3